MPGGFLTPANRTKGEWMTPNVLKPFARWSVLARAALSLQCAGAQKRGLPDWGDAQSGFRLRYRFEQGATQRYRVQLKTKSTQEVMGNEQVQQFTLTTFLSQKALAPTSEGAYRLQFTYDSVRVDAPGAAAAMLQQGMEKIVGKSLTVVLSPLGKVVTVEGAEKLPTLPGNQNAADVLRSFFIRLPERPVKPGEGWSVPEEEVKVQSGGMDLTVRTEATAYTLEGVLDRSGEDALKIALRSKFTLSGTGEQTGASFDLSGSGENVGVAFFGYKRGVLLGSDVDVTSEGVAEITAPQALTVGWRNQQKMTVELVR
jgi:hypothetical protein